ncbi:transketolase [Patescibacteria group bacterium]|nr:transketolase [Patescibacteria group bacterium]MBU4115975.1 transketolase [Patescibacteria group bacterium]
MEINEEKIVELKKIANEIRKTIIKSLVSAESGHTGGSLGMADIFTAFYFYILKQNPKEPLWPERDRLILSNGHIVPARYSAMAHAGYFSVEELENGLRKFGTVFQGHPDRKFLSSMETTSGPLGCGLGQACGVALGAKMDGKDFYTYCIMSDGEHQEGNLWESVMFAGKYKIDNLTGIIDRNNIQITGNTEDVMPLNSLRDKYEAFNWNVIEVDGHDFVKFIDAVEMAKVSHGKPTIIIAHTIPGKGIKEIEDDYKWHGIAPNKEQGERFLEELEKTPS